jgi:hypothetical protein
MSQSFYQKEDLDYLYFARPGTAYNNPSAFGQTQTRSQFFSGANGQKIKPIEMIKSRTKGKGLLQQMWFERAEKTLRQVNHFGMLIEQFEYMGEVTNRLVTDSIPSLKKSIKEAPDQSRPQKNQIVQDIRKFVELY